MKKLPDNLKRPGGQNNMGGVMVAMPGFKFGAKSQMILEAALNIYAILQGSGRNQHQQHHAAGPNHQGFKH